MADLAPGEPVVLRLHGARLRPERAAAFARMTTSLFQRRHTPTLGAWDQSFLRAELDGWLRVESPAYAALAPDGGALIPFALGYLHVSAGEVSAVTDRIPVEDAALVAAMLAEVLEQGAEIIIAGRTWRVGANGVAEAV